MSVNKVVEPVAPASVDATTETQPKLPVGALFRRRSAFSRKLKFFQRDLVRFRELLAKIREDKECEDAKKFSEAIIGYKMLRALCITNNWIVGKKEDDKRFIPSTFEPKLKTILGEQCLKAMSEAMTKTQAEVADLVHKDVSPKAMEDLLRFIEENEKACVVDVITKAVEEMSKEIESRKGEPRPSKPKKKSPRASTKSALSTEEKFRDLMREVKGRISAIRFTKDSHQLYGETQNDIDNLLHEATSEILDMKRLTKERFMRAQGGKGGPGRRSPNRRRTRSRGDSKSDLRGKKVDSVFSKDMIHEGGAVAVKN